MKTSNSNIIEDAIKNGQLRMYSEKTKRLYTKEEQDFIEKFEDIMTNRPYEIAPEKYWSAQKQMIIRNTKAAFEQDPTQAIKNVVVNIITPLPDFLPPKNMIEITTYIVEEWERLTKEKQPIKSDISLESTAKT